MGGAHGRAQDPSEVLSIRGSHNSRDSISLKGGGGSGMVMEEETRWWQKRGGDDGVDLVAVVDDDKGDGGCGRWGSGEDGGDVVDVGLDWMVVGVAAAVAEDAGDDTGNSPKKEKGEGGG
ncbi:hypothetical protein Tco_0311622 [Tanacetum coccineum]